MNKKNFLKTAFFIASIIMIPIIGNAQGITQFGTPTNQNTFPKGEYIELNNPQPTDVSSWEKINKTHVVWGSKNIRYEKNKIPTAIKSTKNHKIKAWKGERVNAQLLVFGNKDLNLKVTHKGDLTEEIKTSFVRYVMTDELNKDRQGACGHRPDITIFDSSLVADVLDCISKEMPYQKHTVQPVWIQVQIPQNIKAGNYEITISVQDNDVTIDKLRLNIEVINRTLPSPEHWAFHLDLWQNPFAEARYFQVDLWSKAHLDAMRPTMEMLAKAGQKVITASIMHKPWGGQTEDYFESMVTWRKNIDGSWHFDFDVFDCWVEFMMSCGINRQINCYSMIPWSLSFQYFDQASNKLKTIEATPSDSVYVDVWTEMLKQFANHLKKKGWFDITTIAMDERPKEQMLSVFNIIRNADKDFKISLAGEWHEELEAELHDYCIAYKQDFPDSILQRRKERHQISTFYTCCTEPYPNTFTFSQPAEAEFLGWYTALTGLDGYLRWAYNSYTLEPLLDSRFRSFAAGDCYMVYPEGRSSIRFEKLTEGIQNFEKINILRNEFKNKNQAKKMANLQTILASFSRENLDEKLITNIVEKANNELSKLQ